MAEPLTWALVANVAPQHHIDAWGRSRGGTRYFAVGAKVWITPPLWGDGGEKMLVLGRRRGSRGRSWSRVVMDTERLTNFRAVPVHSPEIRERLLRPWRPRDGRNEAFSPAFEWTREIAEEWAESRNRREHRWWESTAAPREAIVERSGWNLPHDFPRP